MRSERIFLSTMEYISAQTNFCGGKSACADVDIRGKDYKGGAMENSMNFGSSEADAQELHLGQVAQGPTLGQLEPIIQQWGWAIEPSSIADAIERRRPI